MPRTLIPKRAKPPKTPARSNGKHPGGRPTDYKKEYVELVFNYCLLGAKNTQLAEIFEITEITLHNWMKTHPQFFNAIKAGRAEADAKVTSSLYRKALGYERDEIELKVVSCGNGTSEVEKVKIKKFYPPDTTAAIFWLKNRRPKDWRDRVEHTGEDGNPITITIIPAQQQKCIDI